MIQWPDAMILTRPNVGIEAKKPIGSRLSRLHLESDLRHITFCIDTVQPDSHLGNSPVLWRETIPGRAKGSSLHSSRCVGCFVGVQSFHRSATKYILLILYPQSTFVLVSWTQIDALLKSMSTCLVSSMSASRDNGAVHA